MAKQLLIKLRNLSSSDVKIAGGKAASLGELINHGINVPPGFVITTEVYRQYAQSSLPESIKTKILKAFDKLGTERVSVRSSAIAEDSSGSSWAGQFETFLNVNRDSVIDSVYKCWGSVSHAITYANLQADKKDDTTLAVVVQKMVDSDKSGVAFSVNPLTRNNDEIMIEATYGLGELLVQGLITPDNYIVNKANRKLISQSIQPKKVKLVFDNGTNRELTVDENITNQACLNDNELQSIVGQVTKIEELYGSPQDIEWAIESGQLYILQSRPITA
jgi:phosphoenolpyruvate synthase/pyruvate phosphate dikinase